MTSLFDPVTICKLYTNVVNKDISFCNISEDDIKFGIQNLEKANWMWDCPNFNDPAIRCGYLYNYAPFHTYIATDAMLRILNVNKDIFKDLSNPRQFKICSVGGGPGSDAIGTLVALHSAYKSFTSSVTVIDCKKGWRKIFRSLIQELDSGSYEIISHKIATNFECNYVEADFLNPGMGNEVQRSISQASLVTMVKFLSSVNCDKFEAKRMIQKIFRSMKPGAYVFFVDNANGGFAEIFEKAGKTEQFEEVIPPIRHLEYEEQAFKIEKFGYISCFKSTVSVFLLQKPKSEMAHSPPYRLSYEYLNSYIKSMEVGILSKKDCTAINNMDKTSSTTDSSSSQIVPLDSTNNFGNSSTKPSKEDKLNHSFREKDCNVLNYVDGKSTTKNSPASKNIPLHSINKLKNNLGSKSPEKNIEETSNALEEYTCCKCCVIS